MHTQNPYNSGGSRDLPINSWSSRSTAIYLPVDHELHRATSFINGHLHLGQPLQGCSVLEQLSTRSSRCRARTVTPTNDSLRCRVQTATSRSDSIWVQSNSCSCHRLVAVVTSRRRRVPPSVRWSVISTRVTLTLRWYQCECVYECGTDF